MKPEVLILAIILLLVGSISAAISQMGAENWEGTERATSDTNEVSAFFNEGEKMIVKFDLSDQWRIAPLELPTSDVPYPHMYLYFSITGPLNEVARFDVTLVRLADDSLPLIYGVELIQNGSLTVSVNPEQGNQTSEVGGIVNYSGVYIASLIVIPPQVGLPESIGLYEKTPQISYPYAFLFPLGVLISIFGFALVILWVMTYTPPQRRTRKQRGKSIR